MKVLRYLLFISIIVLFNKLQAQEKVYYAKPDKVIVYEPGNEFTDQYRLALGIGYSRRLDNGYKGESLEMKDYINGLKSGMDFHLELGKYFSSPIGLGIVANSHHSQNTLKNYTYTDMYFQTSTHDLEERVKIVFLGPALFTKYFNDFKWWNLNSYFSLGYMHYRKDSYWIDHEVLRGDALGISLNLCLELQLNQYVYLGVGTNLSAGIVQNLSSESDNKVQSRLSNISHWDMNAMLIFRIPG